AVELEDLELAAAELVGGVEVRRVGPRALACGLEDARHRSGDVGGVAEEDALVVDAGLVLETLAAGRLQAAGGRVLPLRGGRRGRVRPGAAGTVRTGAADRCGAGRCAGAAVRDRDVARSAATRVCVRRGPGDAGQPAGLDRRTSLRAGRGAP